MTLRRRLDRLEGKRAPTAPGPSVLFLCAAETGEPLAALLMGGANLTRATEETAEAFTARAEAVATGVTSAARALKCLRDNPSKAYRVDI